ncbi:hypothetical protein [Agromyces sp. LHK192]|uniref:hypothetical protein n=1 Tax=Agromyces sp. LHK192 TaxID=2498704 RepID=UPI000FDC1C7A|nr:hypothetical protein [Agromyces sp. LHK192]
MSIITIGIDRAGSDAIAARDRRTRASIAFGRKRGYYRVLFESGPVDAATFATTAGVDERFARSWLDEQLAAGILRQVDAPGSDDAQVLLPGEHVTILLGDDGGPALAGARRMRIEHRAELPAVLDDLPPIVAAGSADRGPAPLGHEVERARAAADAARLLRIV